MSLSLDKFNLLQADGGTAWKKYEQLSAVAERTSAGSQQNQELAEYQRELQADLPAVLRRHQVAEDLRKKEASEAEHAFFDLAVAAERAFFDAVVAAETARAAALAEADRVFRNSIAAASAKTGVPPKFILKGPAAHARAALIGESEPVAAMQ